MLKRNNDQETKRAGRIRMDTLNALPKLHDVRMLLVEAERNRGSLCELPIRSVHGVFLVSCQSDYLSPEPCWTLYEGLDGTLQIWSYMNNDLQMICDIVNMSLTEKNTSQADTSTAFADVNAALSDAVSAASAQAAEAKSWGSQSQPGAPQQQSWGAGNQAPFPESNPATNQWGAAGNQAQPNPQQNQWNENPAANQWPNAPAAPQPNSTQSGQWPVHTSPADMAAQQQQQWQQQQQQQQQQPQQQQQQQQWPMPGTQQQIPPQYQMPPQQAVQPGWPAPAAPAPSPDSPWLAPKPVQQPSSNSSSLLRFVALLDGNPNMTVGEVLFVPDIPSACVDSAMRLQEMICKSEISDKAGIEALKLAAMKGTGVVDENVLSEIRSRSNAVGESSQAAITLLKDSGLISESDATVAESKSMLESKDIGEMLIASGKIDKVMLDGAKKCVALVGEGKIRPDQAIIALNYCQRARAPIEQAFEDLSIDI